MCLNKVLESNKVKDLAFGQALAKQALCAKKQLCNIQKG